jgi:hypothetical protein
VGPSFIAPIDFGLVVKKIKAILELMHPKKKYPGFNNFGILFSLKINDRLSWIFVQKALVNAAYIRIHLQFIFIYD